MSAQTVPTKVDPSEDHEIAREEALAFLHFFGVALPPTTKLPLDALLRRIRQCLDAAQETKVYIPNSLLNPGSLPLWTTHSGDNSVRARMLCLNLKDMDEFRTAASLGKKPFKNQYEDPFADLRKTFGTWVPIPLTTLASSLPKVSPQSALRNVSLDDLVRTQALRPNYDYSDDIQQLTSDEPSVPPSNIHGEKLFVVKLRSNAASGRALPKGERNMLVYDRQRSFQVLFKELEDDADVFNQVLNEMHRNGVSGGVKMFRYAKRTGDWEIRLCVDRGPIGEIAW
ncbi:hypothetical protein DL96DRAFT_1720569 [Flagelloscypha sp. PMI_526]|nr:hypothetical protein DL96DRAFT_1720569 [Flagelloscypha sp. PMI_526]